MEFLDVLYQYIVEHEFLGKIINVAVVIVFALILSKIMTYLIDRNLSLEEVKKKNSYMRIVTIMNLVRNIGKIVIFFLAITISLDILGVNTTPIIAAFSVGSLAISFGAQSLIKDIINGFFIILEDQYRVGDLVEILDYQGYVEEFGLRSTLLRDFNGEVHIIPNGKIEIVTNKQKGRARAKVVLSLDLEEDPRKIVDLIKTRISFLEKDYRVLEGPSVWGVTNNTDRGYEITISANVISGEQFKVEYEIREEMVEMFRENNIKLPEIRVRR
ncbi:mechanosensitive ion channel family protein [Anaerosphaera multitolerans]|uniref:Mechanosensitive ion channel family protein n=1 Tax=Anaerosphaera multitolerans TaxID=2487351 RepID=A0A437S7K9_9FIRM|nr:mechanosensitive ion channel family protein [Anaerosphaera multitolerans]RVU55069.1 mechanosensitive ion channel family protein [Anaerosphaera multitolerans]